MQTPVCHMIFLQLLQEVHQTARLVQNSLEAQLIQQAGATGNGQLMATHPIEGIPSEKL